MRRTLTVALLGALAVFLSGCGGSSNPISALFGSNLFGAIATSIEPNCSQFYVGVTWDAASSSEADSGALNQCRIHGGTRCSIQLTFGSGYAGSNECGSLSIAESSGRCGLFPGSGSSRSSAEADALRGCRAAGYSSSQCSIFAGDRGERVTECSE